MSLFNGEEIDSICLPGIEHVISVTLAPTPSTLNAATTTLDPSSSKTQEDAKSFPKVHIRAYTIKLRASGTRIPRVELVPMGPSLDLALRRYQEADAEVMKQAMKRPKLKKQEVEKGLGKKRKNMEVDEMGDLRGRIHVAKQDLNRLQTRKMKGLKAGQSEGGESDVDMEDGEDNARSRNRRKTD